jgi:protein-tyrosine phosphatase
VNNLKQNLPTDIHCHLLPGLDDGPSDWDESLDMARMAADDGIAAVVATPHQLGASAGVSAEAVRAATVRMQELLDERAIPLRVLCGAEARIEPDLVAKIRGGRVLTLADRGRHVLLELPHDICFPLDRLLAELRVAGLVGILSHPERNRGILSRPDAARELVNRGMLMQITAGSLTGDFGPPAQGLAQWLVKQRLVHFVASDAHDTKVRMPLLRCARQRIAKLAGEEMAYIVCCENPTRVAEGQHISQIDGRAKPAAAGGWLRGKKAG